MRTVPEPGPARVAGPPGLARAATVLPGGPLQRRTLLRAAVLAATGCSAGPLRGAADPFTLGVASGDPAPDGVVLWTRLAPDPLSPDGLGGLGGRRTDVAWEVAEDERFARVVRSGVAATGPERGHAVHVELRGLGPGREYFYRFRAGGALSPTGRTRTAPEPSATPPLTICVASCAEYEHGWFTAYRRLAEEEPDLVLHLGDYLYEVAPGAYVAPSGNVRAHAGGEARSLADYRLRHAQYRTDPDLRAAHAVAPWLVVWDDHEVADDWAGEVPAVPDTAFRERRAAGLRAYWENMPLREAARPVGPDARLYRRVGWGALATFHLLDTRQYRDDQVCPGCPTDTVRTLTGAAQERWLAEGFAMSTARWEVLGQQVFFAGLDGEPGPARGVNPDAWDGYPGSRDRVVDAWTAAGVRNAVVLTGDVHAHWAADVRRRWPHPPGPDPAAPVVGTELVTTSITSGGDGSDAVPAAVLAENPHVRFHADRRGYLRARLTPDELRADFRVLPYVSRPGAPVQTRGTFVVTDGTPGAQQA